MSGSYDYVGPDGITYKVGFCKMVMMMLMMIMVLIMMMMMMLVRLTGMRTRLAFTQHLHTFPRLIIIIIIIVVIIFQPDSDTCLPSQL